MTTGIVMWSEPIMTTTKDGEEVAILLLDTQGTFDRKTASAINSFVFGFSIAVSSVMIYNVMADISEQDLDNLLVFAECFRSFFGPFQEAKFVVRDWLDDEKHAYGASGGQQMVDNIFGLRELESNNASSQLIETRQLINSMFQTMTCFLLPPPGDAISRGKKTPIMAEYMAEEFRHHADQLCRELFADEVRIKMLNGVQWTNVTFLNAFGEMAQAHALGYTVDPGTFRESFTKRRAQEATQLAMDSYVTAMEAGMMAELSKNKSVAYIADTFLVDLDKGVRSEILEEFSKKIASFSACPPEFEERLIKSLNKWLKDRRDANNELRKSEEMRQEEKKKFDAAIRTQQAAIEASVNSARQAEYRVKDLQENFDRYKDKMTREQRESSCSAIQEASRISREKDAEIRREREHYDRLLADRDQQERQREADRKRELISIKENNDRMLAQQMDNMRLQGEQWSQRFEEYRNKTEAEIRELIKNKSDAELRQMGNDSSCCVL